MRFIKNSLLIISIATVVASCSVVRKAAVAEPLKTYEELKDQDGAKMLRGIVTKEQITLDTAFHWYGDNIKTYTPDATTVAALKSKASNVSFIIFGGTWCHDTQNILPKYFSVLDAAGFPRKIR